MCSWNEGAERMSDWRTEDANVAGGAQPVAANICWIVREALSVWRGPALAGITAEPLRAHARRLEEERLRVNEEAVQAELGLARHADLVGEHHLRERPRGQLMLALYRSGRQADALATYRDLREAMVEELGIEPSAELQRLQRQILAADPP